MLLSSSKENRYNVSFTLNCNKFFLRIIDKYNQHVTISPLANFNQFGEHQNFEQNLSKKIVIGM